MSVFRINTFEVKPGRTREFLDGQRTTAARQEQIGGFTSRRILRRNTGEGPARTYSVVFEFPDWEALGKFQSTVAADPEFQKAAVATLANADPPALMVSSAIATEVEL